MHHLLHPLDIALGVGGALVGPCVRLGDAPDGEAVSAVVVDGHAAVDDEHGAVGREVHGNPGQGRLVDNFMAIFGIDHRFFFLKLSGFANIFKLGLIYTVERKIELFFEVGRNVLAS